MDNWKIVNDDMKSSKRHVILLSLIFLLKCLSKSVFIKKNMYKKISLFCLQFECVPRSLRTWSRTFLD